MNVHTMTLAPWELDTLEVIDGDPRTHGALVHSEGPNDGFGPGGFAVGVYEQERCVTAYVLEQNETVHVLRGHVCIALDDGTAVELRTGEIAVLPVGRKSTWTFVEATRVLFVLCGGGS
jgi:uncharacterized cupin superfamily protein